MRTLSVDDVVYIHAQVVAQSGGSHGLRDRGALESSVAQPMRSFDGVELYQDVSAKAAALGFFLVSNHPFVDGNKEGPFKDFYEACVKRGVREEMAKP